MMSEARRNAAFALTACALGGFVTTAVAQSNTSAALERSPLSVVHEYIPSTSAVPGQAAIPSNLQVSSVYRDLVEKMLSQSPTFRRQILRIAGAQQLTVRLQMVPPPWPRGVRATTQFVRGTNGRLSASIDITPLNNDVELIAHELEHVIEQLDEVNLALKAGQPNSGVHAAEGVGIVFETTRAKRIGLQVAKEVL